MNGFFAAQPAHSVLVYALLGSAVIYLAMAAAAWRYRHNSRAALSFVFLMLGSSIYSVGYFFELHSPDISAAFTWVRVEYLGIAVIPSLWLLFIFYYTDRANWLRPPLMAGLYAIPGITLALVFTSDIHQLYYHELTMRAVSGFSILTVVPGPWYWVHVAFVNGCLLAGSAALLLAMFRAGERYKRQFFLLFMGSLLPWTAFLIYQLGLSPLDLDLGPFGLLAAGPIYLYSLQRYKLFDLLPVARDSVFEAMQDGVIVLDNQDRVVDMNKAAFELLGVDSAAIGSPVEEVLGDLDGKQGVAGGGLAMGGLAEGGLAEGGLAAGEGRSGKGEGAGGGDGSSAGGGAGAGGWGGEKAGDGGNADGVGADSDGGGDRLERIHNRSYCIAGEKWVEARLALLKDRRRAPRGKLLILRDITERRREEELRRQKEEFRTLADNAPDIVARFDAGLRCVYINSRVEEEFGLPVDCFLGRTNGELGLPEELAATWEEALRRAFKDRCRQTAEISLVTPRGSNYYHSIFVPEFDSDGNMSTVIKITRNITGPKKAEEALRRIEWMLDARRAENIAEIKAGAEPPYGKLTELNTARLIIDSIGEDILIDIARDYLSLLKTSTAIYEKNGDYALGIVSSGWCRLLDGASRKLCRTGDNRAALQSGSWICHKSCWTDSSRVAVETGQPVDAACNGGIRLYAVPIWANGQVVGAVNLGYGDPPRETGELRRIAQRYGVEAAELERQARAYESRPPFIVELAKKRLHSSARLIGALIERRQAEEAMRSRLTALEALYKVSSALRSAETLEEMLPLLLEETLEVLNTEAGAIWLYHPPSGELRFSAARGWFYRLEEALLRPGEGIAGTVFATGEPHISREFARDPLLKYTQEVPENWGGVCLPVRSAELTVGVLFVSVPLPREITPEELKLLTSLAEMAGTAVNRISLHEETVRHLERHRAMRTVNMAITGSLDLGFTLDILLEHVTAQLGVDAAAVFLLNPHLNMLEYAAGRGFNTRAIEQTRQRLGESCAGRAALERSISQVTGLEEVPDEKCASFFKTEGFAASLSVPLIAKGEVKGVLQVFHRGPVNPDAEQLDFLEALADQAALAVDNARLFEDLQRANLEMVLAYDATIEGWARALELRNYETEGHSRRVAEMTVCLAWEMGIKEEKLLHVQRGALLHDIGKLAIPDTILLKPGKLTDEEWENMRRHPRYAYEMLSPIDYLRPALDIPYYHHEKWDGSGYPCGLAGEEIPLEARIFAVVDVYDALTSDRPYRRAWTREQALEYIRSESGRHFDPKVVELFLKEIEQVKPEA